MNAADQRLLVWLNGKINTGVKTISITSPILSNTTQEGRNEARRLAELNGCRITFKVP